VLPREIFSSISIPIGQIDEVIKMGLADFDVKIFLDLFKEGWVSGHVWVIAIVIALVGGFVAMYLLWMRKEGMIE
jgi:hypothetical protein